MKTNFLKTTVLAVALAGTAGYLQAQTSGTTTPLQAAHPGRPAAWQRPRPAAP
jgi:hypothetical protein